MRFKNKTQAKNFVRQIIASNQTVFDTKGRKVSARKAEFGYSNGYVVARRKR